VEREHGGPVLVATIMGVRDKSDVAGVVECLICGCPIQRLQADNPYKKPPTLDAAMKEHTRVVHPKSLGVVGPVPKDDDW
jgi:hypothetical protein